MIVFKCDKCGKLPPVDEEKSTKNWTAYKTNEPCSCGGTFVLTVEVSKNDHAGEAERAVPKRRKG